MRSKKALVVFATSAFLLLVFGYFQIDEAQIHTTQGATMGTTWSVQINSSNSVSNSSSNAAALQAVDAEIEGLLRHLDLDVYSTWAAESELSRLNTSPPESTFIVSSELMTVLVMAKTLHGKTEGAFDITIGPLVNLWGFGPQDIQDGLPDTAAIELNRRKMGMADLVLDEKNLTVLKRKPLTLDLSAIAKGFAVDKAAALLMQKGFNSFLVEIGGEIFASGLRPDGKPWVIAIESPLHDSRSAYDAFANFGEAIGVAGSGDYRNFREIDGTLYSHEIDPRTGYPISHNLSAVTVIAESTAEADAWATALMVLGPEAGKTLADSENLAAYFIMRNGVAFEHTYTAAFARFLYPKQGI
ncbi:MAG: FAD:protein FMN transferase [Pseudomonadota bacterium]